MGSTPLLDRLPLIHHSDRGSQYLSIRYTDRLREAGIESSVGSVGDSYDNALAKSVIGLYKTELIRLMGPWKGLEQVKLGTLEWLAWFNESRLLARLGYVPPIQYEASYHQSETVRVSWLDSTNPVSGEPGAIQ